MKERIDRDYWLKQEAGKPLFPELEWSRPENRQQAGKLLIVGGNLHGFAAPAEAYQAALQAGIGTARVLLPDALHKTVGRAFEQGEFAPSTPSGSFSQKALDELLLQTAWADAVLVAGDLGRNSETAILLEKFLTTSSLPIVLTKDAVDYVTSAPESVLSRSQTLLVLSLSQLQRLGIAAKCARPITFGMDLLHVVEWLHDFTLNNQPHIIVKHTGSKRMVVAVGGRISTTQLSGSPMLWRVATAARAGVWWLQHPAKSFEALTTSLDT